MCVVFLGERGAQADGSGSPDSKKKSKLNIFWGLVVKSVVGRGIRVTANLSFLIVIQEEWRRRRKTEKQ